ncbi:ABC transporter ATP-binding protein [Changpingibacter yushuensis]|uniref:dipeptide ABC transporter ATP-binding protein n=1 Tax=Changpingibacter yushuensis TaxID=2758440 RepID=UPI0015F6E6BC|nr:ABC transporter ATP-binding protein [Changpingibacter yushuensis]
MTDPILSVRDLTVSFPSEAGRVDAVRGVNFDLMPHKTLGIVGESGSGKSVTSLAVMGLLPQYSSISGSVKLGNQELLGLTDEEMSEYRGKDIGMIFQDPLSALTPVFDIGTQLVEALQAHDKRISDKAALARAVELLDLVGIPNPQRRVKAFPHEFSGGMRQRVVIAQAIANNPRVLIADEPTTALDVTIQAQILEVIAKAQEETGAGVIMITHDMGVVAGTADDVVVMYAGKPVETGSVDEIFHEPHMPYTIGLLGSIPRADRKREDPLVPIHGNPPTVIDFPDVCPFNERCPIAIDACRVKEPQLVAVGSGRAIADSVVVEGTALSAHENQVFIHSAACIRTGEIKDGQIDGHDLFPVPERPEDSLAGMAREDRPVVLKVNNLVKTFPLMKGSIMKRRVGSVYAVNGISFELRKGETLAIVGESGSGKSTTLLEVMDLGAGKDLTGEIILGGTDVTTLHSRERRQKRRNIQMVFQDPMGALDPRMTVRDIIAEPLTAFGMDGDVTPRVRELMDTVGLKPEQMDRFPGAFSGGQRQRIGLARALATNPEIIVLDEPVSALDVSIQADVINLLDELKLKLGLSYLFVAHDLSVIHHIADRVAVMYLGKFVETGTVAEVFSNPEHPYTQALLSAVPIPDPDIERNRKRTILVGDLPSPTDDLPGCAFRSRCPLYQMLSEEQRRKCNDVTPALVSKHDELDHANACHYR